MAFFRAQTRELALRGGSWNNNQRNARVEDRNNNHPDNNWNNNNGFRLVLHRFAVSARRAG
jgi:formylglycine-generating enzyme required for sulfatase activity